LGIVKAPTGADFAVHNDAANVLVTTSVSGQFRGSVTGTVVVHFVLTDGNHLVETAYAPADTPERRVVRGASAMDVLGLVQAVVAHDGFHADGSTFTRTAPAATLVPAAERAQIHGTYLTTVDTADGFVTRVTEVVAATDAGHRVHEHLELSVTQVGSRHLP
jgi:hypothetical protein